MIRLTLVALLVLGSIAWGLYGVIDSKNTRIKSLSADKQELAAVNTSYLSDIQRYKLAIDKERELNKKANEERIQREKALKSKIESIKELNDEKSTTWRTNDMPKPIVCMHSNLSDSAKALCNANASHGVDGANSGPSISNEKASAYTFSLELALQSCNASKARLKSWLEAQGD